MAHKSAYKDVLAGQIPVNPKGDQPPYFRSKKTMQTSAKLIRHQICVADALKGKKPGTRAAVREAFTKASKDCAK